MQINPFKFIIYGIYIILTLLYKNISILILTILHKILLQNNWLCTIYVASFWYVSANIDILILDITAITLSHYYEI